MFEKCAIKNVPNYAYDEVNPFWVVRECDGDYWFYGAYADANKANETAMKVGGEVLR